jgi:hypothetical protein
VANESRGDAQKAVAGDVTTNPYEPPKEGHDTSSRSPNDMPFWKRFRVLGIGILVGVVLSFLAGEGKSIFWVPIACGPIYSTLEGWEGIALVGWLGAMLSIVHPIKPNVATTFVTVMGLILWFLSGFVGMVAGY